MLTHETENHIILCPNFKILSAKVVVEIQNIISNTHSSKIFAIDMHNISSISSEFLQMLVSTKEKLCILNCCAEILVVLNLTNTDKNVKIFNNLIDLEEDRRELRNRKFAII